LRQLIGRHHFLDVLEHKIDQHAFDAQQVADAGGDHVFDMRLADDLRQGGGEIVQYDDGFGAGILQLMLQFARGVHRVGIDHDHAGAQCTEQRDRILQHVGQHDRHAIALAQSQHAGEVTGELAA
jgi:hypothetical protein